MEIFKTIKFRIRENRNSNNEVIFIPERLETSIVDAAGAKPRWINANDPYGYCYFLSYDGALNMINEFIKDKTPTVDIIHELPELTLSIPIEMKKI